MVKIRLFRIGANKKPGFRIIAIDSRRKRQGRALEVLGVYEPRRGGVVSVREDAIARWIERGAQLTPTVRSLLARARRSERAAAAE
jgi:small subunit ribosomal protein S16